MKKEVTVVLQKQKEREVKQALKESIDEGAAGAVSSGITNSYITPFALALNGTAFQIGLLSSLSGIISPIAQIFGSKMRNPC
jgi:hypothetical protein